MNGMQVRGLPGDYEEWGALGNEGWSFTDVLRFACCVETELRTASCWLPARTGALPG